MMYSLIPLGSTAFVVVSQSLWIAQVKNTIQTISKWQTQTHEYSYAKHPQARKCSSGCDGYIVCKECRPPMHCISLCGHDNVRMPVISLQDVGRG